MREFKSRVQPGGAGFALMFAATAGLGVAMPGVSAAQVQSGDGEMIEQITVTARKRDESLMDVPISITAVTERGDGARNALRSIADIAPTVPGLNMNSDSVSRAFVSIRGIGTALQAGVQPGVGVFQDGMYRRRLRSSTTRRSTSRASKCCAARRARCTARTRWAARST